MIPTDQLILNLLYAFVAATAVLLIEAAYLQFASGRRKKAINRRLGALTEAAPPEESLQKLLRERGLTASGDYMWGLVWLNRLYSQSGRTGNPITYFGLHIAIGLVVGIVMRLLGMPIMAATIAALLIGIAFPLLWLRRRRAKRLRTMELQLPDALDMIVRSLKAGHPTSVAVGLVAREMPDPVGTEFGIVYDEVTFGSELETAVRKMAERVGFEGLQLLSVALSIQGRTGGNLAEILENLSKVLRDRMVLRMKIRSLSSEGRVSAIILSAFPVVMFGILMLIAPSFYGEVWNDPMIMPVFTAFGLWALFGDFIMYRMVNFDF